MSKAEILIIDDEAQIRKLLDITLQSNDFNVKEATTVKDGLIMAANHPPDLIILDLGLPDGSGHDVLTQLRAWYQKPIIILSVQSDEENIVRALDSGANDYLIKPFRTSELLARIRTALRISRSTENSPVIESGNLKIDLAARTVKKKSGKKSEYEIIKLTATEYTLLALFAQHEGKVLTHQFLLRQVWGPGYFEQSQYLRVFVAQLRKKIEDDANRPKYILTESGVGYRFALKE